MKMIPLIFSIFILTLLLPGDTIPVIKMNVGQYDELGNDDKESCFGCGDCSIYCAIENEYSITSSSELSGQGNSTYKADNIDDYNLKSAWIEGQKDYGIGEWVEYRFDNTDFSNSDLEINGLFLFNGYRKSLKSWEENSRIKKLKITINGEDFIELELQDTYKIQSCEFDSRSLGSIKTLRFEIIETYPGMKFKDVALSELRFKGIHHH